MVINLNFGLISLILNSYEKPVQLVDFNPVNKWDNYHIQLYKDPCYRPSKVPSVYGW
jgi:hypothetical protein